MASMRDELEKAIADSVTVVVGTYPDGTRVVRSLDDDTTMMISKAVLKWLRTVPLEGYVAEAYEAGRYSRDNVAALVDDIEDDA